MKIAIDCRPLQNRYARHGVGVMVRNLLNHLVRSRCSTSLVLCGSTAHPPIRCGDYRQISRPASHDWLWEQMLWPVDLVKMRASIFHSTVSLGLIREIGLPFFSGAKTVATVHDLTPLHLPALEPHVRMNSYRIQKMAVRRADRVIAVSSFVKDDLVRSLGVREERIRVLPMAVDETVVKFFDARHPPLAAQTAEPFILGMGETENKNIATSVAVFERLSARGFAGRLRIVGSAEAQSEAVMTKVRESPCRDRIVFTGEISTEQLVENYASCALFLFPSIAEGFGLPVVEAMYCGAPVITSNATSLPETGGNAALCFDPLDADGMTTAAEKLIGDEVFRSQRIELGRTHARRRSWSEAAETVIGVYEELGFTKG
jgi:glycosyltransferase involved in cell wall biosynthesis